MNDFELDFLKLTHSLDPTKSHAMMVCGHARPDQCRETVPHLGADDAHPCGASDASDPAAALASGFFCELLNATTTTTHGEVLVYGKEKIEFLEQTHAEDLAAGLTPQLPVLHLEIVEIEDLLEGLDLDYEDYDFGIGPSAAPETSGPVDHPVPRSLPREAAAASRVASSASAASDAEDSAAASAASAVSEACASAWEGGGAGRGNNLATQQVLRSSYYGNPGTSGQIAYYGTSTVGK